MADPDENLRVAERVAAILASHRIPAVVIGAVALAAHRYVRFTEDIDLAVNADLATLRTVAEALRHEGFAVELREPDGDDPLGGVIDVSGPFGLVQVVNYGERFPAVIDDALREAAVVVRPGSSLRVVPLPHLIALKLYAGGFKSKADIVEVLARNPQADVDEIRTLCRRYRLKGLEPLLQEISRGPQ